MSDEPKIYWVVLDSMDVDWDELEQRKTALVGFLGNGVVDVAQAMPMANLSSLGIELMRQKVQENANTIIVAVGKEYGRAVMMASTSLEKLNTAIVVAGDTMCWPVETPPRELTLHVSEYHFG